MIWIGILIGILLTLGFFKLCGVINRRFEKYKENQELLKILKEQESK